MGTNLPKVGGYNRSVVLDAIQLGDGISRVEIAMQSGLTPQTVSGIVRRLIEEGLVREDGAAPSSGGKPRAILRINAGARYAVGIHFDPSELTYVVADLSGHPVTTLRRPAPESAEPDTVIREMAAAVRTVLSRSKVPRDKVIGIGVGCPGPIDQERGMVVKPPQLFRWERVPIRQMLEERTEFPVTVDNDATAAAIGERWAGAARKAANFAYLYLGTGIGGGLFLGGHVYRGSSTNAAEFGHVTVETDGPECYCGNHGCLEAVANPAAIVAAVRDRLRAGEASRLKLSTVDYPSIVVAALAGDPVAASVIDLVAKRLADAVICVANVLDLDLIVLGGHATEGVGEWYRDAVAQALQNRQAARRVHVAEVTLSAIGPHAASIGAAALVLHGEFTPSLSTLLSR